MPLLLPLYTIDLAAPPAIPSTLEIHVCAACKWTTNQIQSLRNAKCKQLTKQLLVGGPELLRGHIFWLSWEPGNGIVTPPDFRVPLTVKIGPAGGNRCQGAQTKGDEKQQREGKEGLKAVARRVAFETEDA